MNALRGGLDEENAQKIIASACMIKSSSKQIGAILVSKIAEDIEAMAHEIANDNGGDMAVIAAKLEQLVQYCEKTHVDLETYLASFRESES